nr:nucleoside recognition protein [uncultured Desulfobulbus sp.]
MKELIAESLRSAVKSGLLILKFVIPLYILADVLLYFDLLRYLGALFTPLTAPLDLPPEAAVALAGGVFLNIYAAIAFAAPLGLSAYQWTILAVFLGVCHSMIVESAIMAKLGISTLYSVILRSVGACIVVLPVLFMPHSWFADAAATQQTNPEQFSSFLSMLLNSMTQALQLSVKIIALISLIIVVMDLLKRAALLQKHMEKVNTSFSIIAGQLLGITYGAGILLREASRGTLSRENILYIGTFLMICHSIIEDVVLFVLFGANYCVIIGVRLPAALLISFLVLHCARGKLLDWLVRPV